MITHFVAYLQNELNESDTHSCHCHLILYYYLVCLLISLLFLLFFSLLCTFFSLLCLFCDCKCSKPKDTFYLASTEKWPMRSWVCVKNRSQPLTHCVLMLLLLTMCLSACFSSLFPYFLHVRVHQFKRSDYAGALGIQCGDRRVFFLLFWWICMAGKKN